MQHARAEQVQIDAERYTSLHHAFYTVRAALERVPGAVGFLSLCLSFGPILLVWELVVRAGIWSQTLFPSPLAVLQAGIELSRDGRLLENVVASMRNLGLGFFAGAILGVPLGVLMGLSRWGARFFDPTVNLLQAIPGLAWIPLAILWFGLNTGAVTFIIFTAVFFPLLFSTLAGVRATDQVMIDASLTLGARKWHLIRHIILPSTMPFLITGVRLGVGYGFRALVGGEMIAATAGLGWMVFDARSFLRSDIVVLGMLVMGTLWLVMDRAILKPIERRTTERWGMVKEL